MAELAQAHTQVPAKRAKKRAKSGRPIGTTVKESFGEARRRKEWALAKLREQEVEKRGETLVNAEAMACRWSEIARRTVAGVLAAVARIAAALPHLTREDLAVIDREIRAALTALADASS